VEEGALPDFHLLGSRLATSACGDRADLVLVVGFRGYAPPPPPGVLVCRSYRASCTMSSRRCAAVVLQPDDLDVVGGSDGGGEAGDVGLGMQLADVKPSGADEPQRQRWRRGRKGGQRSGRAREAPTLIAPWSAREPVHAHLEDVDGSPADERGDAARGPRRDLAA
jgi:hypothetical protein